MTEDSEASKVLANFLKAASQRWGADRAEEAKSNLKKTAEAVAKVQSLELMPEEEPALTTTILEQQQSTERKRQ